MSEARIEKTYADLPAARAYLDQARLFLHDATTLKDLSSPSQSILLHNATICACDAILQAAGQRVSSGDRSHEIRIQAALEHLDGDTQDLYDSLDASRERRNEASYAAGYVAIASLEDAREATIELYQRACTLLGVESQL